MFENPFTSESKKAKKSLFDKKPKNLSLARKVSAEMTEKIKPADLYYEHEFRINREQATFLYALEDQLVRDYVENDKNITKNEARKIIYDRLNYLSVCKINEQGQIIVLNLNCLNLTCIPEQIEKLVNLQEFSCESNQLQFLPEEITQLINLHSLLIGNNKIKKLPKNIGNLINLYSLECLGNLLRSVPKSIAKLNETLKFIDFTKNKFRNKEKDKISKILPNTDIYYK